MSRKRLLLRWKSKQAAFRVEGTDPPLEEISLVGKGRLKGRLLTSLQTTVIRPTGKSRDNEEGGGILWLAGNGRAEYKVSGTIGGTRKWRELAHGTMFFGNGCVGSLKELKNTQAIYETLVNSKGESETKVWSA